MTLTALSLDKFVAATASGDPVPGGGSISALCGALAAALGEMVARLTVGKKKYADVQPLVEAIAAKLGPVSPKLVEAVDTDSEAYDAVFAAYKLPKDTDEQKAARTRAIQAALKHAASVPLSVAQTAASILPELRQLAESGNQNAITDAYVGTLCARTAILGAGANVRINLSSITDDAFVQTASAEVMRLSAEADRAELYVSTLLNSKI